MSLSSATLPVPLKTTVDGVIRVGGTRVTLDSLIILFKQGATAEEIASRFPSLDLADIYATIAAYLRDPDPIEDYLKQRQQIARSVRETYRHHFDSDGIRDRLIACKLAGQNPE